MFSARKALEDALATDDEDNEKFDDSDVLELNEDDGKVFLSPSQFTV